MTTIYNYRLFVLTAGSQVEDHEKQSGIVSSHAYAILDVQSITVKGVSFNLIKLRNVLCYNDIFSHGVKESGMGDGLMILPSGQMKPRRNCSIRRLMMAYSGCRSKISLIPLMRSALTSYTKTITTRQVNGCLYYS